MTTVAVAYLNVTDRQLRRTDRQHKCINTALGTTNEFIISHLRVGDLSFCYTKECMGYGKSNIGILALYMYRPKM